MTAVSIKTDVGTAVIMPTPIYGMIIRFEWPAKSFVLGQILLCRAVRPRWEQPYGKHCTPVKCRNALVVE